MRRSLALSGLLAMLALLLAAAALAGSASAEEPQWRLEPITPPNLPSGQESSIPIGLGKIADIEFWGPNRGLLITSGNPPTIPPGLWAYNGQQWHQLATVCGASDGRIAWAGPDEFWTISDGRPGQANSEQGGPPPLADNTLCHFSGGQVVGSYASLAFRADSYQAMHAAGCVSASECWFAGDPLPEGQVGAFHLHWDGSSLTAQPNPQGHPVEDMRAFKERLYESVRLSLADLVTEEESALEPSDLHLIRPVGAGQSPFLSLTPGVPKYAEGEFPQALDFLQLASSGSTLWGAANPVERPPEGSAPGEVTVERNSQGLWSQILGPTTDPVGGNPFTKFIPAGESITQEEREREKQNEFVRSIAVEPLGESAWLALSSPENASRGSVATAMVARIAPDATVSDREELPSPQETAGGIGPKGAADKLACPAVNDCWLATTQGWLFHLSEESNRYLPLDGDPAFANLITFRPADAGVPPVVPDAPPADDSGLPGEARAVPGLLVESSGSPEESRVTVPLLSHISTRLRHGDMLEVRFHLAVKARVRLLAKRRRRVVASTPNRILQSGNRKLTVRLNLRRWPTKLDLQTHALAPLPTASTRGAGTTTVGTGFHALPRTPLSSGSGTLP
jgi:hypothetical protein